MLEKMGIKIGTSALNTKTMVFSKQKYKFICSIIFS